jgi:hypothetical protein
MKRRLIWLAATSVILLTMSIATVSFAVEDSSTAWASSGWTIGIPSMPDVADYASPAANIDTIMGKVTKIEPLKGVKNGLQMRLKPAKGSTMIVWMGPKWFIENQRLTFKAGDDVEVRGRKFNASTLVATEISKGDLTMKLRNEEDGLPSWECCFPRQAAPKNDD